MEVPELKYVDFELKDGIGMITMNNPEKLNALTMEGAQSLTKILNACSDSPGVRVIVICGAQGNFCGGGDVKGMKYKVDNNCCETRPGLRCNNDVILSIVNNAKPVIAWLEGAVAGGGLSIALACDFSYAQLASKFVFAFVNIGFIPDMGSSLMLTKNLGAAKAKELLMLGHRFTGEQAADWGIITAAAAPEDLEEMVMKTAKKLAKGPALAYERMKRLVNRQLYQGLEDAMENEGEYQYQLCKSEDHAEAIHAFFEKRKPDFKGR